MNGKRSPGPVLYGFVFVLLACYFGWMLDRLATFSQHGMSRLAELGVGVGLGLLALAIAGAATRLARRGR